nr:MAG TPA: FdhE-like protein [Caudoviricetes sp.]
MSKITKCAICGSYDVTATISVRPNNEMSIREYCLDEETTIDDGWCNNCGQYVDLVAVNEDKFPLWQQEKADLYIVSYRYYDPEEERPGGGYDKGYYDLKEARAAMKTAFDQGYADYDNAVFESCVKLFNPEPKDRAKYADLQAVLDSCDYDDYPYIYCCDNHPTDTFDGPPCPECGSLKFEVCQHDRFKRCGGCGRTIDEADAIDLWRCSECGSKDVLHKHWINPNTRQIPSADDLCLSECECNYCDDNTVQMPHSMLLRIIDDWFTNHLDADDPEVISGLEIEDFASEEEFDAACQRLWDARSDEEKIEIWKRLTYDKHNA